MTRLEYVKKLLPMLYPTFYTVQTYRSECEYVFLDTGGHRIPSVLSQERTEAIKGHWKYRTTLEALENHVHLFDRLEKSSFRCAVEIGKAIAENMLRALKSEYPAKSFVVFLTAHIKDGVIVRFHQKWDDEPEYLSVNDKYLGNPEVYEFR